MCHISTSNNVPPAALPKQVSPSQQQHAGQHVTYDVTHPTHTIRFSLPLHCVTKAHKGRRIVWRRILNHNPFIVLSLWQSEPFCRAHPATTSLSQRECTHWQPTGLERSGGGKGSREQARHSKDLVAAIQTPDVHTFNGHTLQLLKTKRMQGGREAALYMLDFLGLGVGVSWPPPRLNQFSTGESVISIYESN